MKCIFLSDYANKKEGTICSLNGAVAGDLIRRGIAKAVKEEPKETKGIKTSDAKPIVNVPAPQQIVKEPKKRKRG